MSTIAHLVNFALALVFWMILGRMVLGLLSRGRENFFTGVFAKATEPAYALARRVTGGAAPEGVVPFIALVLVVFARLLLVPLLI